MGSIFCLLPPPHTYYSVFETWIPSQLKALLDIACTANLVWLLHWSYQNFVWRSKEFLCIYLPTLQDYFLPSENPCYVILFQFILCRVHVTRNSAWIYNEAKEATANTVQGITDGPYWTKVDSCWTRASTSTAKIQRWNREATQR